MVYDPHKHHRRSTRLIGYDYSGGGAYFLTLCTWNRECLFGELKDDKMRLNQFGEIVREEWLQSAVIRRELVLDIFQIMPNHIHGIVMLADANVLGSEYRETIRTPSWASEGVPPLVPPLVPVGATGPVAPTGHPGGNNHPDNAERSQTEINWGIYGRFPVNIY